MKTLAFYLPQFHEIEENNKWWGKGFTEWVNVKKATPLFRNHNQPREPLNDYYYDLLKVETLKWQSELAKKYRIDGFCFYHYWFNGKRLLDKPAELLLDNKDIDLPFLFSWANEPWTRSWDGSHRDVIMPQSYGDESDWLNHFNYLKPFFEDERYIKHNGKPVFLLYRSASFEKCNEWIQYWRKLARETSFGDIHFVSTLTSFAQDHRQLDFDAELNFEPMCTFEHNMGKIKPVVRKIVGRLKRISNEKLKTNYVEQLLSYQSIWDKILEKDFSETHYSGAFVDWDNTPRKKTKSLVMKGSNPEIFKNNFDKLYKKSLTANVPYLFINAWNEWAEGTYLEPDKKNGHGYLEAVKETVEKFKKNDG
ncbi:glycoside hydrolase family 99-like domain-containing protein [Enterobacter asburiae]|nr:glycoside hydrolase family 99-like domain-containing protein [Enterobacter asburiae]HBH7068878.1 glycoside hydrolase family 99-like domain-containing protein [Enterobacter cloacae]